jgi:PilZ domain-containing protein
MQPNSDKPWGTPREERRRLARKGMRMSGKIVHKYSRRAVSCVILNLSATGAKLLTADILDCPDEFELRMTGQRSRECKVVWRNQDALGVKFK